MQIGFVQIFIEDFSGEIVRAGVHQVYDDAAVCFGDVHQSDALQIFCSFTFLGGCGDEPEDK